MPPKRKHKDIEDDSSATELKPESDVTPTGSQLSKVLESLPDSLPITDDEDDSDDKVVAVSSSTVNEEELIWCMICHNEPKEDEPSFTRVCCKESYLCIVCARKLIQKRIESTSQPTYLSCPLCRATISFNNFTYQVSENVLMVYFGLTPQAPIVNVHLPLVVFKGSKMDTYSSIDGNNNMDMEILHAYYVHVLQRQNSISTVDIYDMIFCKRKRQRVARKVYSIIENNGKPFHIILKLAHLDMKTPLNDIVEIYVRYKTNTIIKIRRTQNTRDCLVVYEINMKGQRRIATEMMEVFGIYPNVMNVLNKLMALWCDSQKNRYYLRPSMVIDVNDVGDSDDIPRGKNEFVPMIEAEGLDIPVPRFRNFKE